MYNAIAPVQGRLKKPELQTVKPIIGHYLDTTEMTKDKIKLYGIIRKTRINAQNRIVLNGMKCLFSLWQCGGYGFESRMLHHFQNLESNADSLLSRFSIFL